jgi:hypothetical protein
LHPAVRRFAALCKGLFLSVSGLIFYFSPGVFPLFQLEFSRVLKAFFCSFCAKIFCTAQKTFARMLLVRMPLV